VPTPISTLRTTTTPKKPIVDPRPPKFAAPKANITLPPNLGRPPVARDLIIKKGFDGLTREQAVAKVLAGLGTKVAPQNATLAKETAGEAFRNFNVAMSNTFLPGSPNNVFLKSLGNQQLTLLGTMSSIQPTVYKAVNPANGQTKYYARDWTGNFAELPKPPLNVVMEARLRLEPPGLVMSYPKWKNAALSGPLSTIVEL
jgi:hypothetical protein